MSACGVCHGTRRYHPLGGQELTPCPNCAVPTVSPLEVAWAKRDRLRAAAEEAQDDYMRAECHARTMGERPDSMCKECLTCRRPESAVNHVAGHIFVGYGIGWQPCLDCGGSCRVPK